MEAASDMSIPAASGRNVSCPNFSGRLFLEASSLLGQDCGSEVCWNEAVFFSVSALLLLTPALADL